MRKRLLIDGDVLLYHFAFAHQYKIRWDDKTVSEVIEPFIFAADDMERFIEKLLKRISCDDYVIALSHPRDFRFRIDPEYQANRRDRVPPIYKESLREQVFNKHPWAQWDWCEGDDVIGIMATQDPEHAVMASIDKDLRQIPGVLYNWQHDTLETITPDDADFFFFKQVLTGDSTDCIRGIPGVGPKKAETLLDGWYGKSNDEIWARVLEIYHDHGLTTKYALQQARLVRILRAGEYDFTRRKPILWKGFNGGSIQSCNYGGTRKKDN